MPSGSYHEALWEGVPAGSEPSNFSLRRRFLLEHIAAGEHVLDVGCGEGWFARELVRAGASVVGIDVAEEPLRRAGRLEIPRSPIGSSELIDGSSIDRPGSERRSSGENSSGESDPVLDLRLVDAYGPWPLDDASFDVVWAGETIEHVADTIGWLSEIRRVLRPGGRLLLSTPDHGRMRVLWLALSRRAFEVHFDPRVDHLRFYTRAGLTRLLDELGFHDVSVRAAAGPPGARRLLLARAVRSRW
jgi:SAM-dependent methyltransferase